MGLPYSARCSSDRSSSADRTFPPSTCHVSFTVCAATVSVPSLAWSRSSIRCMMRTFHHFLSFFEAGDQWPHDPWALRPSANWACPVAFTLVRGNPCRDEDHGRSAGTPEPALTSGGNCRTPCPSTSAPEYPSPPSPPGAPWPVRAARRVRSGTSACRAEHTGSLVLAFQADPCAVT